MSKMNKKEQVCSLHHRHNCCTLQPLVRLLTVFSLSRSTTRGFAPSWTNTTVLSFVPLTMSAPSSSRTSAGSVLLETYGPCLSPSATATTFDASLYLQHLSISSFTSCPFVAIPLQGLREHSVVLMGKNTLMRRCIRLYVERTGEEKWNSLSEKLIGNVGIIFTNVSLLASKGPLLLHTCPYPCSHTHKPEVSNSLLCI